MKYKYKTRKNKKQTGRGVISGIKSKTTVKGIEIPYIKICPEGYSMCDQDEVNSGLCVQNGQESLCSDPNYTFRYIPPDAKDRNGLIPKNRLIREENGAVKEYVIDLTKKDLLSQEYYFLRQNDIVYVKQNKAKVSNAYVSQLYFPILTGVSVFFNTLFILLR
jgi:hypothetical protein